MRLPCGCEVDITDKTFMNLRVVPCPLHAAAQELLEACKMFVTSFISEEAENRKIRLNEALIAAAAAIRKAEQ